jgi:ornithine cyclodeaminase
MALVLGHAEIVRALPMDACIEAMAAVFTAHARGELHQPLRSVDVPPQANGFMGLMPAYRGGAQPLFSLKAVCIFPGNPSRGLDAHQGTVTLFDGETGAPTAILDASAITEIRTAAVSALATRLLARNDARRLAILGAGVQAAAHLKALRLVRQFDDVRVYSPNHADRLCVPVAASAQEAVRDADVIVTATNAREPVLERAWLKDGAHVNAVGASAPTSRELDTATAATAALFCDSRDSLEHEAGEYRLALTEGLKPDVRGTLGEVAAGLRPGRTNDHEITLFRSLGLGIEDMAAAELAVHNAREHGLGTEVAL